MAQMNISIPEGLKAWAERRVAEGRYASTSDYMRDLVRRDQEIAEERAWFQTEIEKGRNAPKDPRSHDEIFDDLMVRHFPKDG